MVILTKSTPQKKCFFWNGKKKSKIGRRWPGPAGTVRDGFRTPPQKHLTPFHKKIIVRSSILKKYLRPKGGGLFLDSTVPFQSKQLDVKIGAFWVKMIKHFWNSRLQNGAPRIAKMLKTSPNFEKPMLSGDNGAFYNMKMFILHS